MSNHFRGVILNKIINYYFINIYIEKKIKKKKEEWLGPIEIPISHFFGTHFIQQSEEKNLHKITLR